MASSYTPFLWGTLLTSSGSEPPPPPLPPESKEGARSCLQSPNQPPSQIRAGIRNPGAVGSDLLATARRRRLMPACLPATFKRCEGTSGPAVPSRKVPANRYNPPLPFTCLFNPLEALRKFQERPPPCPNGPLSFPQGLRRESLLPALCLRRFSASFQSLRQRLPLARSPQP